MAESGRSSAFEITRAWCDPAKAFSSLAPIDFSLLLHDGQNNRAWIFAFPEECFQGSEAELYKSVSEAWKSSDDPEMIAGLFGYELASIFESLPESRSDWPALALGRYPAWAEFDRSHDTLTIRGKDSCSVQRLLEALEAETDCPKPETAAMGEWSTLWSREQYVSACLKAREYVHAGDVFQVNLSQAFDINLSDEDDPWKVFQRLIQSSPAPHSAYFRLDENHVVLTNSPERFLSVKAGKVEARPIKGTRPRHSDPIEDQALVSQLRVSEKDRAENLMIVDLMRNDLARVCLPGSISVPSLCAIESYTNVHHLVSVVEGQLAGDKDVFDLIAASFPPGSITGAPKVRAMEIIAELEGEDRGPYCGALGWISDGGDMDLNVMIRTAALTRKNGIWSARVRSGGGIVSQSDPHAEYEETLTKVSALRQALEGGS